MEQHKQRVPWQAKIGAKLVLARLPIPYAVWGRVSLIKHGAMTDLGYAEGVFRKHAARCPATSRPEGFTCLELGPGDSLLSAIIARAHGSERTVLVDVGPFARMGIEAYREAGRALAPRARRPLHPDQWTTIDEMLADCQATYLTGGPGSLQQVEGPPFDLIWSHAVLEHVRRAEWAAHMREIHRLLAADGVSSHLVDLRDHVENALNHLRFSEQRWESPLFQRSGFYTNRLRRSEIERICRDAGFIVTTTVDHDWPAIPTPRAALDPAFQRFDDEELRVAVIDLVLRCAPEPAPVA